MNLKILGFAALLALTARPAAAIELETVDTREQRGAMGFVDMQRVFRAYPETIRAKENFEELVRQAEEQINLRKADILHLRNEFSQLKIERDFIAKSAPSISTAPAPGVPVQPSTGTFIPYNIPAATTQSATAKAPAQAVASTSTLMTQLPPVPAAPPKSFEGSARPSIASLPGLAPPAPPAPAASTTTAHASAPPTPPPAPLPTPGQPMTFSQTQSLINAAPHRSTAPVAINISTVDAAVYLQQLPKKAEPLVINIPGVSTAPITVLPPSTVTAAPSKSTAAVTSVQMSTTSVQTNSGVVQAAAVVLTNPALAELDAKIALKFRELSQKETDFKEFQAAQEKSLLNLESRKTEILMGKIYKAIQDVAHLEGVSVVEDKSNILFGHAAVDLTDKVIKYLQSATQ